MKAIDYYTMLEKHTPSLRNFAYSFTHNLDDAADLLQDTFVKAIKYEKSFESGTNLKGWLMTIMRNTFINSYRQKSRASQVITVEETLTDNLMIGKSVTNDAIGKFTHSDIQKALSKLPEQYLRPFMDYFEGYKYEEIAEANKLPIGTIKTRIHIARNMLKKQLKDIYGEGRGKPSKQNQN